MNNKVVSATKWSAITEIIAKLISPITTIILARILAKEVFGIVASITAITSLADLLTDAGFNAYIIQHQFLDEEEKNNICNVCFWSNLGLSIVLIIIIIICRNLFSDLVGASGYSLALVISSVVIPLTSISSVIQATMKKDLSFKKLGIIKVISKIVPLLTTIPLALIGLGYWSLIIGAISGEMINVILCLVFGDYKPKIFYRFRYLKKIFSFSSWAFLESILEWLLANIAILVLANFYGNYYLGVFKTGLSLISQITTALYSLYSNVYKSALSREQNNQENFSNIFMNFQKVSSIFVLPIGVGAFLYRNFLTNILLGSGWEEAITIIGLWALISMASFAFGNFYSDGIRAKGKPVFLVLIDAIYLSALVVLLIYAPKINFNAFCIWYCLIKIIQPVLQILFGVFICKVNFGKILINTIPQIIACAVMSLFVYLTHFNNMNMWMQIISILICIILYFAVFILVTPQKKQLFSDLKKILL